MLYHFQLTLSVMIVTCVGSMYDMHAKLTAFGFPSIRQSVNLLPV
jgi:hypothetical protein